MKNKLYTKSYFVKRLREAGFSVEVVFDKYNPAGMRYWTVMVDPGGQDIMVTCVKKSPTEYSFKFMTENLWNYTIKTSTVQLVIEFLSKHLASKINNI